MGNRFIIEHRLEKGRLFLSPVGDLDGSTAWQIIHRIAELDDGRVCIVIDTNRLDRICPFGRNVFRWHLRRAVFDPGRICFRGEKGAGIAPPGCRVSGMRPGVPPACKNGCPRCGCEDQNGPKSKKSVDKKKAV